MSRSLTRAERTRLATAIARRSPLRLNVSGRTLSEAQAIQIWKAVRAYAPGLTEPSVPAALLDAGQKAQFRRAFARQTGRLLDCASGPVSFAEAHALWMIATRAAPQPSSRHQGKDERVPRVAGPAAAVLAALPLAACATLLGGNVKGSFSCSAPGGSCAPSTVIDDSALAMIQNARPMTPAARPWSQPPMRGDGKVIAASNSLVHRDRRVLKVVFPAFVDQRGFLHEARVVHAVADTGGWMQLGDPGDAQPSPSARAVSLDEQTNIEAMRASSGLAIRPLEPVADTAQSQALPVADPKAPDPAQVAAARARGLARLPTLPAEIKAAVDARLGTKPSAAPAMGPPEKPAAGDAASMPGASVAPAQDAAVGQGGESQSGDPPSPANAAILFPGKVE